MWIRALAVDVMSEWYVAIAATRMTFTTIVTAVVLEQPVPRKKLKIETQLKHYRGGRGTL